MTSAFLRSLVRELRQTAEARLLEGLPDAELLERFRAGGDPEAFEAIVRRHGPAVLSACRKVLTSAVDVEDAFQATFLVLLRSAGTVRQGHSLGGWLYGVAHRVALKAFAASARRQRLEQRQRPRDVELPDLSWREACAVLHEELDHLPDSYRLPLILCYLEGKSRDEAAQQLGIGEVVLHGRLERGRKQLRSRLTRRGITLSAGLWTVVASSVPAGGPPESLVRMTLQAAATGRIPAKVAALLHGTTPSMSCGKIIPLAALFLLVTLIAVGLNAPMFGSTAGPTRVAARPGPAETATESPQEDPQEQPLEVKGQVIDPAGKPVAGAKLTLVPRSGKPHGFEPVDGPDLTGADGRFHFSVPRDKVLHKKYDYEDHVLIATAPGYYPGWDAGPRSADNLLIRLPRDDAKVAGRILDLEGRPVAKATVRVTEVFTPVAATLDSLLEDVKDRRSDRVTLLGDPFLSLPQRPDALPGATTTATTDADGRFELAGYGKDRVLKAVIEGPNIASTEVLFATRDTEPLRRFTDRENRRRLWTPLYGTRCVHVAPPARLVTGVVRDHSTKRPLAGVVVKSNTIAPHAGIDMRFLAQTVTDTQGRFTLAGLPKGEGNSILVIPGEYEPYIAMRREVPDLEGVGPVSLEFDLVRGVWIEGTVTDKLTGKPKRWSVVEYYPDALENNTVASVPGLPLRYASKHEHHPVITGADGKFRIVGLPGHGYLAGYAHESTWRATAEIRDGLLRVPRFLDAPVLRATDRSGEGTTDEEWLPALPERVRTNDFHAVYRINVSASPGPFVRNVTVDPGHRFTVSVVGPDGKPVARAQSFGVERWGGWAAEVSPGPGLHEAATYNPAKPRVAFFRSEEKNIVGRLTVPADFAAATHTATLEPGVVLVGRVVDARGRHRPGVRLRLDWRPGEYWVAIYAGARGDLMTDGEGRFRINALLPGLKYELDVDGRSRLPFTLGPAESGTKDLGDVRLDR